MVILIISTVAVIVYISRVTISMNMTLTAGVRFLRNLKRITVKNSNLKRGYNDCNVECIINVICEKVVRYGENLENQEQEKRKDMRGC